MWTTWSIHEAHSRSSTVRMPKRQPYEHASIIAASIGPTTGMLSRLRASDTAVSPEQATMTASAPSDSSRTISPATSTLFRSVG